MSTQNPDVVVENHGSLFTFILCTPVAREWVSEHVEVPSHMWHTRIVFACEHRFACQIVDGMSDAGLIVV